MGPKPWCHRPKAPPPRHVLLAARERQRVDVARLAARLAVQGFLQGARRKYLVACRLTRMTANEDWTFIHRGDGSDDDEDEDDKDSQ